MSHMDFESSETTALDAPARPSGTSEDPGAFWLDAYINEDDVDQLMGELERMRAVTGYDG